MSKLSRSEEQIYTLLSFTGPLTSKTILEWFHSQGKNWKKQTLNTFLSRMIKKGKLSNKKITGTKHIYTAI